MRKSFLEKFSGKINLVSKKGEIVNPVHDQNQFNVSPYHNHHQPKNISQYSNSRSSFGFKNKQNKTDSGLHWEKLNKKGLKIQQNIAANYSGTRNSKIISSKPEQCTIKKKVNPKLSFQKQKLMKIGRSTLQKLDELKHSNTHGKQEIQHHFFNGNTEAVNFYQELESIKNPLASTTNFRVQMKKHRGMGTSPEQGRQNQLPKIHL